MLTSNQLGTVFYETVEFRVEQCCRCGVAYAMTAETYRVRKADGGTFYCPNGHPQVYTESTETKLRNELARERARRDQAEADARYAREDAKRTATVFKGKMTKLRNRVGNGVCPCCNRFFKSLQSHMSTQHPDFKKPEAASA